MSELPTVARHAAEQIVPQAFTGCYRRDAHEEILRQTERAEQHIAAAIQAATNRLTSERDAAVAEVERLRAMSTVEMMGENANVDSHVQARDSYRSLYAKSLDEVARLEARVAELEGERRDLDKRLASQRSEIERLHKDCEMHRGNESFWQQRATAAEQQVTALREALAYTLFFREFTDEWHDMNNPEVVEFRRLRSAALAWSGDDGQ